VTARRGRGEGGLHWDESRQRWIATAALGFDARGKRITRKASGTTKTAAKAKLREILRDHAEGLTVTSGADSVEDAVRDWLAYDLAGRSAATVANYTTIAEARIIAPLGRRRLRDLSAEDVDRWLRAQADEVSTRTLRLMHSILNRAVVRAMARNKVQRNVVALCSVPVGQAGRPSKSLTLPQAEALLAAAEDTPLHAYVVLSLLTGARTEEVRALRWKDVDLSGNPHSIPPVPPSISVLRSVRQGGDTRPASRDGASPSPAGASTPSQRTAPASGACPRVRRWSSAPATEPNWTRTTSAARSAASPPPPAWTRQRGHHGNCGTASCPCCRTPGCHSSRSPGY
jgi:hypothetical protein